MDVFFIALKSLFFRDVWCIHHSSIAKTPRLRGVLGEQQACKPGFVVDDHLSSHTIADTIERVSTSERTTLYADLLAADRVYLLHMSPYDAVSSYLTHFTLTSKYLPSLINQTLRELLNEAVLFLWHFP